MLHLADTRNLLPAAGTLPVRGVQHERGKLVPTFHRQHGENEEFLQRGGVVEDRMFEAIHRQGDFHYGFEIGADAFLLTGPFNGLLDSRAHFEKIFHDRCGLVP